jgi:hypothetical protein
MGWAPICIMPILFGAVNEYRFLPCSCPVICPCTPPHSPNIRLIKTGALSKSQEKELARLSAWAEFFGYLANIALSVNKLKELAAKERQLLAAMEKKRKVLRVVYWGAARVSLLHDGWVGSIRYALCMGGVM